MKRDRAERRPRRADERAKARGDRRTEDGKAVAIERRELRAKVVARESRALMGSAAIRSVRMKHEGLQLKGFKTKISRSIWGFRPETEEALPAPHRCEFRDDPRPGPEKRTSGPLFDAAKCICPAFVISMTAPAFRMG